MSVRRSLVLSTATNYFAFGMNFLLNIALARALSPHEMGIQALAVSVNAFLAIFREFGASAYLLSTKEVDEEKLGSLFTLTGVLGFGLGGLMMVLSHPISLFYHEPRLSLILKILAVPFFLLPFGSATNMMLTRDMRFELLALNRFVGAVAATVSTLVFLYFKLGVVSISLGIVTGSIAAIGMLFFENRSHFFKVPRMGHLREMVSFGYWSTLSNIVRTFGNQGNELYMGRILGLANLGLYSRATTLVNTISLGLMQGIGSVSTSHFASLLRNDQKVGPSVHKYCDLQGGILFPILAMLSVFSHDVMVFLYGEKWAGAAPIMTIVTASWAIMLNLHTVTPSLLVASGRLRELFWTQLAAYAGRLLLVIAVAPVAGLKGAAWAIVASNLLLTPAYLRILKRYYDVSPWEVIGRAGRSLAVAALTAASAFAVRRLALPQDATPFEVLAVAGLTAAVAYPASLFLLRHPVREEAVRVVGGVSRWAVRSKA